MRRPVGIIICVLGAILQCGSAQQVFAEAKPGGTVKRTSPDGARYTHTARIDSEGTTRALYNAGSRSYPGTAEQAARAFLGEHTGLLRTGAPGSALTTGTVQRAPGGSHVRFVQTFEGIPVFRGDVVVSLNTRNQVGMVVNNFRNSVRLASTQPALTADAAITRACVAMRMTGASIGKQDGAELMIFQDAGNEWRLAYRVEMTNENPYGDWEIFIDATTGEMLSAEDRFVDHTDGVHVQGSGYVFQPDPLSSARSMYNSQGFVDNDDADTDSLNAYRTLVSLDSITCEDGVYTLKGPYCAVTDIESPADPVYSAATPEGFLYTRNEQAFEAVNVYYHVSKSYQHIEQLGFSIPSLRQIRLDPHGYYGQDNSHFSPSGNWIAWGEGGVDDAEDADVIWHEYGHAIQFNLVPAWGGGESGALGEGFGDYWAASYSRSVSQWSETNYHYNWVFNWDGHNPFWAGRILNDPRTYPFAGLPIHSAGQIWSSALMGIWGELGREITDKLVLKSMLYLGSGATAPDNAHALIQADRDLYNGAHIPVLLHWLGTVKRFINPDAYVPQIVHTPAGNSANVFGPFTLQVEVASQHGVGTNGAVLHWGINGTVTEAATMTRTGTDRFVAHIPGIGIPARYQYYITVVDSMGGTAISPGNAPAQFHTFQAGTDAVAPVILHAPLDMCSLSDWPPVVTADVTDDLALDSVWVEYVVNENSTAGIFRLPSAGDTFSGEFPLLSSALNPGDSVRYRILARDFSATGNTSAHPAVGFHTMHIQSTSSTDEREGIPGEFALLQNYPNPFNPSTAISFRIPDASEVTIRVYSVTGEVIATLVEENLGAGSHTIRWNGTNGTGEQVSSGVYLYRIEATARGTRIFTDNRKMLLIR